MLAVLFGTVDRDGGSPQPEKTVISCKKAGPVSMW